MVGKWRDGRVTVARQQVYRDANAKITVFDVAFVDVDRNVKEKRRKLVGENKEESRVGGRVQLSLILLAYIFPAFAYACN